MAFVEFGPLQINPTRGGGDSAPAALELQAKEQ
jgi:hypothetical protein